MQARLASLGLHRTISELRETAASAKPKRPWKKRVFGLTPLRRSERINRSNLKVNTKHLPPRRSERLRGSKTDLLTPTEGFELILIFVGVCLVAEKQ